MAFFFVGIVIADVTQGNSEDLFLGRTDGHNHAAYGANTHSNSGVMNKGENSGADSNERKLMIWMFPLGFWLLDGFYAYGYYCYTNVCAWSDRQCSGGLTGEGLAVRLEACERFDRRPQDYVKTSINLKVFGLEKVRITPPPNLLWSTELPPEPQNRVFFTPTMQTGQITPID
ncbi:Os04g0187800 [Oryza sativa Japonica Group]|uniref:Os04g0187800 protein n=1 Tax=Oryza sativa subsp. japonica TaxID=39947 RepID=Q0JEX7_ORYSJ|nr:Os04g0187800 [Oryza sativa Japonica Group]|eukprot:NP_001052196.2 Os04g0187800 [Oryza sativa Japonica Group]